MKKVELEVKILDINKDEFIDKIKSLGATLKKETKQFLYTYDLPTIYGRIIDIKTQLKDNESEIKYETALEKLKLLFFELDNLLTGENKKLNKIIACDNVVDVNLLINLPYDLIYNRNLIIKEKNYD